MPSITYYWNNGLADRFLNLNPRPSVAELRQVIYPPGLGLNSQNQNTWRGYVPDPQKLGGMKYDEKEYLRTFKI